MLLRLLESDGGNIWGEAVMKGSVWEMEKTIRVTGRGQVAVPPDRIRLKFSLEERKDTYQEAVEVYYAENKRDVFF